MSLLLLLLCIRIDIKTVQINTGINIKQHAGVHIIYKS
jgi:hypothetical protein